MLVDVGPARGGTVGGHTNTVHAGWLADAGVGLRIVNAHAAFASVLHIDIATLIKTAPGLDRRQVLVRTKASFLSPPLAAPVIPLREREPLKTQ